MSRRVILPVAAFAFAIAGIAWVVVGILAGFLAGQFMRGSGYGLIGDLVIGLVGAVIGGLLSGMFMIGTYGFAGSISSRSWVPATFLRSGAARRRQAR
jgi:uncharacterized membrane protein YeaQ/YmgE (transglycosylase-associated protein family)